MALHIADSEVDRLASELARLDHSSKTEALRRLLRRELEQRKLRELRQNFGALASRIAATARTQNLIQVTKDEMDSFWGERGS